MKTIDIYNQLLAEVPNDVNIRIDWSSDIADRIAALMDQQGLTAHDLAKRMGRKDSEVALWLGGTHNFTLSTLAKISDALGTKLINA